MDKEKLVKKEKVKQMILQVTPIIGLLVLFLVFMVLGNVMDANIPYSLKNLLNQSVVVAIIATGAIFIYAIGSFDISLGASCCVSALLGGMVYIHTESVLLMFLTCIGVAVLIALINSTLASIFNLPVFVTTVAMLSVLGAISLMLININGTGDQIAVDRNAVAGINNIVFKFVVLIVFVAICWFIFDFTPVGRKEKYLGGNPICAKLTGIDGKKIAIIAFVLSGIGVGIGAFLSIIYAPTLTQDTASSVGMDVIIAIVFGGMPVSGGARSKIYAAVIGAFSMTLLSQIMLMLNLNSGIGQMVKAVIFIVVVFLAMSNGKNKRLLPR